MFQSFYSLTPLTPSPKGEGERPRSHLSGCLSTCADCCLRLQRNR
jgi:hypothetical protein